MSVYNLKTIDNNLFTPCIEIRVEEILGKKDHIIDDSHTCDISFTKGTKKGFTQEKYGVDFNCQTLTSIAEIVYFFMLKPNIKIKV